MNSTSVDALPEELQLSVFTCLGSPPPSELKSRQEPSLQLTSSQHHILKSISLVSKRWRRIILPLLFKHARLRVDITSRPEWVDCSICAATAFGNLQNDEAASFSVEQFHTDMMKAVRHRAAIVSSTSQMHGHSGGEHQEQSSEAATVIWASHVHHALADFLHFVQNRKLSSSIESVVLFAGRMLAPRIPQPCIIGDPRYSAAAVLWQELLSTIDPSRVTIMAPPTELVYLANAGTSSRTEYVDWAFGDMDFHVLELRQGSNRTHGLTDRVKYSELQPYPQYSHSFASSSVIRLRPWEHIGLNEGSFLKAYGTYEYFERGPPSLVYSIKQCISPVTRRVNLGITGRGYFPAVRSFSYTAMFPFANHADFVHMLPYLEELDLQFAPDPQSGILDDKERTGKAELQDCWQELFSAYQDIATMLNTFGMSEERFPQLKKFVCRDFRIQALRADLDEIFTPLRLPVWVEAEPGVFTRIAMSARLPGVEGVS